MARGGGAEPPRYGHASTWLPQPWGLKAKRSPKTTLRSGGVHSLGEARLSGLAVPGRRRSRKGTEAGFS